MDLRLTFNEDAPNYDRLRPTYTDELFDDVIRFSSLSRNKRALEIGIGTGQATLPFLKTSCKVTAIEIGEKLAQFTREKFREFNSFEIINQDFESVQLDENAYDLVYSASAFHWIPQEIGLPKVHGLLKSGGVFAWFSIQPVPAEEHTHIHEDLQKVYEKYSKFFGEEQRPQLDPQIKQQQLEKKRLERFNALRQYGFVDVTDKFYYGTRTFNAQDYTTLISTYSDHKAMPEESRMPFLREIAETIDRCGGKFALSDTMFLCMGRKP
ncbi:class I SAM-dependent methyltransferase [Gorillibacterium massiliense]|uniref:class I SAM-dependent methyltransferase n=1 Tax=Gorillibacterium massiliense TaxID=1280390 RepID=UPI0004B25576|nr:class I SAM-dependent methyltransferase [Gorillibacterium massiliense]